MKLSDLVRAKKYIDKINPGIIYDSVSAIRKDLDILGSSLTVDFLNELGGIDVEVNSIKDQVEAVNVKIQNIKQKISAEISALSAPYCVAGNVVNDIPNVEDLPAEAVRNLRSKLFSDETNYEIISTVRNNTKPIYPALEIRCGDGYWTKYMVAADPLYIVDIDPEFLNATAGQFPIEYQRRLRQYLLGHDGLEKDDLGVLPKNQFSFILAVSVFDFFTLDRLHNYIQQIHTLLRPGGVAFFTYNNCEESKNVKLVEQGFKGWATKTELEQFCKDQNFEILESNTNSEISWLEIRKPGELTSVKMNQALGEIITVAN